MPLCFSGGICEGGKVRIGVTSLDLNVECGDIDIDFIDFLLIYFWVKYTLKYTEYKGTHRVRLKLSTYSRALSG